MKNLIILYRLFATHFFNKISYIILSVFNFNSVTAKLNLHKLNTKNEKIINFQNYRTDTKQYPTWVDFLFDKSPFPDMVTSIGISLIIYCAGFFISLSINFQKNYINTFPIYLGCFGIGFVCYVIRFGSKKIHSAYEQLRPCFLISDNEYNHIIREWYKRLSNNTGNYILGCFLALLGFIIIYFQIYEQGFLINTNIKSFGPDFFVKQNWYTQDHRDIKALILCLFAFLVGLPLATASRIILLNIFLLFDFKNLPVIPIPNLIRSRLRKTANFYIFIAVTWFMGVSLFGILFFNNIDVISICLIFLLSLLGILTFFTPQLIYSIILDNSEAMANKWILKSFYENFNINLLERENNVLISTDDGKSLIAHKELIKFSEASLPAKKWIYEITDVLIFLTGQTIAILSPWTNEFIEKIKSAF